MTSAAISREAPRLDDQAAGRAGGRPEEALRGLLQRDPNDARSFTRLVALLVRLNAERRRGDRLAVARPGDDAADETAWALAAELARRPGAWYPLIELARLSLPQDSEAAVRRLTSATDRDPTGRALTRAVELLRSAGHPDEAFRIALARWRPAEHGPRPGRQLLLAGLEAGRIAELCRHLDALSRRPGGEVARTLRAELARRTGPGTLCPGRTGSAGASGVVNRLLRLARTDRLRLGGGPRG
jgi:hypothetical protein